MFQKHQLVSTSKFLSLILRHRPEVIGLKLSNEGWLAVNDLVRAANENGKPISLDLIHEVVATNEKRRFEFSDDGLLIRASQGHSIPNVDLKLTETQPPQVLYHGTVSQFLDSIRAIGLQKRSRNHVHLSSDEETARQVGIRRGKPIILRVSARKMAEHGHTFYLSKNGVWLTAEVPTAFLEFPE